MCFSERVMRAPFCCLRVCVCVSQRMGRGGEGGWRLSRDCVPTSNVYL